MAKMETKAIKAALDHAVQKATLEAQASPARMASKAIKVSKALLALWAVSAPRAKKVPLVLKVTRDLTVTPERKVTTDLKASWAAKVRMERMERTDLEALKVIKALQASLATRVRPVLTANRVLRVIKERLALMALLAPQVCAATRDLRERIGTLVLWGTFLPLAFKFLLLFLLHSAHHPLSVARPSLVGERYPSQPRRLPERLKLNEKLQIQSSDSSGNEDDLDKSIARDSQSALRLIARRNELSFHRC